MRPPLYGRDPKSQLKEAGLGGEESSSKYARLSQGLVRERGKMNKTEAKWADHLNSLISAGKVVRYWFEPFGLRLSHPAKGQPLSYTPDFLVLENDGTTFVDDVKGRHIDEAAYVRVRAAAEQFSLWRFRIVQLAGTQWTIREI